MRNSQIFEKGEADNYFNRNNANHGISLFVEYLLSIFPNDKLSEMDVAEFGIGNGANLLYLSEHAHLCHGYEISKEAVVTVKEKIKTHHHRERLDVANVNLSEPFSPMCK